MAGEKLNFFQQLISSISGSYKNLAKQPLGRSLWYLLFLSLILGSVYSVKFFIETKEQFGIVARKFEANSPDFAFKNGELTVDGEMPIVMGSKSSILVIDTTGNVDEGILEGYEKGVFIGKDRMINKKNRFVKQEVLFNEFNGLSFNKNDVVNLLPLINVIIGIIAVFLVFGFIGGKYIAALFVSIFALILNGLVKAKIPYNNLFTISVYALSLPIVVLAVKNVFSLQIPVFSLLYFALAVVYVWIGVKAAQSDDSTPPIAMTSAEGS